MNNEKQRKTFISYSRVNTDFAIKLAKELKLEEFDVWLDQLDIPTGVRWDREVEKALKESSIFMIILTTAAVDSENVLDEIGYAIDNGKRILPVLLEKCDVPLRLRRFQHVDFTDKSFNNGVESAKNLLRSLIAQPSIPRAEFTGSQVQAEAKRKVKEEADRLAAQKAEKERLTSDEAEIDRRIKEEAYRLFAQKAEEERKAKEKSISKGLMYGIGAIVVLAIVGFGLSALSNSGNKKSSVSTLTTQTDVVAPAINEQSTQTPTLALVSSSPSPELNPPLTLETAPLPNSIPTPISSATPQSSYVKVNWRGYCKYLGYADAINLSLTIAGWKCVDEKGKSSGIVSYTEVCKWQVGFGNPNYLDPNDYDSWVCKTE